MTEPATKAPGWFRATAFLALFWNLLGCAAFLRDALMTPAQIEMLTEAQRQLYAARPGWAVAGTAVAVFGGAAGSIGLIARKSWAISLFWLSLAGLAVQDIWFLLMSNATQVYGSVLVGPQAVVAIAAIGLLGLAYRARSAGWID